MKKMLVIFGIVGAGAWLLRDRLLAGVLELGGKVSQFIADHTPGEDESDPRTIRFPAVDEEK